MSRGLGDVYKRQDRDLVGPFVQDVFRIGDAANAASDTEWDVEHASDATDPAAIYTALIRTRRDVIEDEFISTFVAVTFGQLENVPNHAVVAKLHAFDDHAVADIKAGTYALCRNAATSALVIAPSSSARPEIAAGIPCARSCSRSPTCLTPPEACNARFG